MIPEFLKEKLNNYYSNELLDITKGYSKDRHSSLRINSLKTTKEEVINYLKNNNIDYEEVEWYENAIILKSNFNVRETDLYKEGKIYLQSLSSQIPPLIVDPKSNEQILDMTAAPGGKTTELAALSNNTAMITAIEKNKIRYDRLKYNIEKQGAKRVSILQEDSRNLNEFFIFDKILLDAPCSGSGTDSVSTITEELIDRSVNTQKVLIREAIKHLKVNGTLVYSTCSILKEENELIIKELLDENPNLELEPINIPNIKTLPSILDGTITIMPNEYYEGFFVAKIKKAK